MLRTCDAAEDPPHHTGAMAEEAGCSTPEAAALDSWHRTPGADPRVVSVDVRGTRAEVLIHVADEYPDFVYCYHLADGWHEACSGNGPSLGWDDPTHLIWPDSPDWEA